MKNYGEITINEYTLSIIHFFHFSTPELWGCWGTPWTCCQSITGLTQTTIHTQIHQYSQIRVNTEPMSLDWEESTNQCKPPHHHGASNLWYKE